MERTAPLELDSDALEFVLLADWPENLRGIDRLVHRMAVAEEEVITLAMVERWLPRRPTLEPDSTAEPTSPTPSKKKLPAPNKEELIAALEAHEGSVRAVAKHFGRDRRQIYRWMDNFELR